MCFLRSKTIEPIKLEHVVNVFETSLHELSDNDTFHMCLLYLLEKVFNDRLPRHPMKEEYLGLVSNFDDFNRYHVLNLKISLLLFLRN